MKKQKTRMKSETLDTVERERERERERESYSLNEKKRISKLLNERSGITMVALVVTIVVLLILASISIQGITRTGIFRAAEDTKLEHKRAAIATTLQTKLKINQTEQIRGTDEEIIRETYEDVKNDLEEIKKAGGKDIEVSEVTSEEKDGKTEWFFEVKVDGDVYKVGLDGSDYLGKEDELSPVIQIKVVKTTTNTIAVTATTRRNEGGKIEYYIKEKGSTNFNLVETTDQNEFTYTKLKQDTTFVVKAVAIGKNGQKKASNELEAKTSIVPKLDSNDIKFAAKPDTWTKESVEVTATLNVNGQTFSLATSKNTTTDWVTSNRQIFTSNGTMYAALTDGNNYGITASYEVTNIDKEKPEIKSITATTNTIKITATDNASGIKSYAISESSQTPTKFTIVDNTKLLNKIIENVKQSTKYYVWVKDEAGNISNAAEVTTATVPKLTNANTTITKTPSDWTNQSVTAKAETTEKGYSLQTKKDNGEWQNTDTQNYTENGTIYARLWDGTNAGEETYANITNIDKAAPTSTGAEIKNVTAAGYDVYVYGVKDAGSGVNRVQFPTWTEANGQDDIQGSWQTSTAAKGTKQQDGTTWVYHVNITDHKTEAGVYNTHVYAYDNLGNGKYIFGQQITVPKVKITYDENYIANGETESKKQTVEKIYNTELGTLSTPTRTGYTFVGWFTEKSGGTQISGTTKTPVSDTTYYAHWTANQLNFANQTITKTFSTNAQTANITAASNGTGSYTYTEKTETNASGTATNYISINGTTINIAANTPAGTYTYVITATDNGSKVTKDATYTIKIERAKTATAAAANKTYNGANQPGVAGTNVTWTGTTSAIDAGTYTATATPDGNHAWSDGTTNAKAITWKINPKSVAVTWGTTTFTYNGNAQAPTATATSGVNGETINVTRTTATNAGSYTSTASISSVSGGRAKAGNYTLTGTTKAFTINPSSTAIKVYYPTSATGVGSKKVYRNKCSSSSTVLSTTNTGTSNNVLASTYNGLYGSFGGYATTVNTTARATTAITGIATRTETTYYIVTTGSNTSSITATFNYYNGSAWTSTTKAGTRTNNYTYYCTSTTASKTATSYSHGSIAAPSTSTGPYSTAYVGWSTGSKSMSTTSVTTANTTYYAVYRSNVTVRVVTGPSSANMITKTIYRNSMKDGTVLSESNTGTSNLTTISGAYNYAGLATSSGTGTITAITTCAASTTNTFYTVGKTKSNATITVTYKYQNGSNDTTATGTKTTTTKYYINSANQVSSTTTVSSPSFTMPKPTRTGYEMDGWNTSSTATTATYTAGQKVSIGNSTTLYAIWYQCAAKINTTYYRTVQKAIDSVATSTSTSTTVTVLKNVTENITILENKIIALNLNEKTIKGDVSNKGTLNIYGGTVDGKSAKKSNCIANIGTLTVTNGTYSGKDQGIYNYSGTTTVKGGTISGGNWGIYGDGMIIVSGGNSTGSSYAGIGTCQGTLKITGGSFTGGYNGIRVWDNNANATIEITNGTFTGKTDSGLLVKKTKATISGGTYDGKDGTDGGYFEHVMLK